MILYTGLDCVTIWDSLFPRSPIAMIRRTPLGTLVATFTDMTIVDFDSFLKVLNRPGGFRDPGEPEEYCEGFKVFDKELTGEIGQGQLKYSE